MRKRKENFLRSGVAVALAAIAFATGIDRLMVKGTESSLVKISNNVFVCLSLVLAGSYKSFIITINSFNMELTKDDREKLDS